MCNALWYWWCYLLDAKVRSCCVLLVKNRKISSQRLNVLLWLWFPVERQQGKCCLHAFPSDKKRKTALENAWGRTQLPQDAQLCSYRFSHDVFESFRWPKLIKELTGAGYTQRLQANAMPPFYFLFYFILTQKTPVESKLKLHQEHQGQETMDALRLWCRQLAPVVDGK